MSAREELHHAFNEESLFKDGMRRLQEVCEPYGIEAFQFVLAALEHTQGLLPARRHVTGRELLDGILAHGKKEFGPMALSVFEHWGIVSTEDFGRIVFKMVAAGILAKTEQDSLADFKDVYDLKKVFEPR